MPMLFLSQLVACAAYLLLTYAFFTLADRANSSNARFAAVGFAYSALTIVAQLVLTASPHLSELLAINPGAPSGLGFWILFGLRPFVLVAAAVFAVRFALSDTPRKEP
jgi:hypothetical protein